MLNNAKGARDLLSASLGIFCVAALMAGWFGLSLAGQLQKAKPTLRINSPFAATLWRLDVDKSENHIVASSPYKAVSVWPLQDLQSRSILRVPIRKEQRKRAHGVAISPDGKLVATSVPPEVAGNGSPRSGTAKIYLLDRQTGEQRALVQRIPTRPQVLRFSPDGQYLAAVLSDGCGLRVWKAPRWTLFYGDDSDYGGGVHCSKSDMVKDVDALPDTTGLAFSKNNPKLWLVTSGDTGVRTYGHAGGQAKRLKFAKPSALKLERPGSVGFSPDGSKLLVGERRNRALDGPIHLRATVLFADSLDIARKPFAITEDHLKHPAYLDRKQNADANQTSLEQVAWVKTQEEEEWIFAGGVFWCTFVNPDLIQGETTSIADICIARFSVLDEDEDPVFIPVGTDRVMDMINLPKRQGLLFATQRRIGLIDYEGEPLELADEQVLSEQNGAADFRDGSMRFMISPDGKKVLFDDYRGRYGERLRLQFDLTKRRVNRFDGEGEEFIAPNHDKNLIEGWRNSRKPPVIYGEPLREDNRVVDDQYRAAALVADRKLVLLGSSDFIRLVEILETGPKTVCRLRVEHEAFRVNLTPDGRTAVVGHSDGTLRWYRIERTASSCRLQPLLSVHIAQDEFGTWVWTAWLPSGEFANDPRAKKQIGWQVERTSGKVGFVPYHKLLRLYDDKAVALALDQPAQKPSLRGLLPIIEEAADQVQTLHVGLRVATPFELAEVTNKTVRFQIDTSGLPKSAAQMQIKTGSGINMAKIIDGKRMEPHQPVVLSDTGAIALDVVLPQAARRANRAMHVCFHVDEKAGPCHGLIWQGKLAPPKKRRLWAIIIGISKHKFASYDLQYTQNDALDIAQLFVDDYQKRSLDKKSAVSPDFSSIHLSLIVSPNGQSTSKQLKELVALPYVEQYEPTKAGILRALADIVKKDRTEDLSNDLFLFHFSGHGFIHPTNKNGGRSAFVTYTTDPALPIETLEHQVFTSEDLISALKQISAEKLVVFDACRVPTGNANAVPFDPGLISAEFQDQVLSAHYFFSGLAGQYSLDQSKYAINSARPIQERGNGLFSYAFLKSLTDKKADLPGKRAGRNRIDIFEVKRYLDQLFDLDDDKSLASEFRDRYQKSDIQQPVYVPARKLGKARGSTDSSFLRTLDSQ